MMQYNMGATKKLFEQMNEQELLDYKTIQQIMFEEQEYFNSIRHENNKDRDNILNNKQ